MLTAYTVYGAAFSTLMKASTRFRVTSHTLDAAPPLPSGVCAARRPLAAWNPRPRGGLRARAERAEWTDAEIVGVDPPSSARRERKRPNLIEHPGSVTAIPMPDASFDAVLCLDMLEHCPTGRPARRRSPS